MSLINDMLQKLDRRQQRPGIAADLPPAPGRRSGHGMSSIARGALVVTAALLLGIAAFALERLWPQREPGPPAPERIAIEVPERPPRVERDDPGPETVPESGTAPAVSMIEFDLDTEPEPESEALPDAEAPAQVQRTLRTTTPRERADDAYNEAVRHLTAGRRARAEAGLEDALGHDAAHHDSRSALAGLLYGQGRTREAETLLQEGLRISPRHAPFADQYARILMQRGDLAGALGVLERAAPPVEENTDYHALMGYLQQRAGNHDAAAGIYRALVDVRDDQGRWWLGLGISLEALRQPDRALAAYNRARNDPRLGGEVIRFLDERIRVLGASEG